MCRGGTSICFYGLGAGLFDALNVGAVAGVDFHLVADVAEQGHANFGTGFNGCGLESVGGGIALDAGFGVGDFEDHAGGHFASEDSFRSGVNHSFADVAVLEELNAFDAFAGLICECRSAGILDR